jgi:adenine-specific DNA-methyltransferase
MGGSAFEKAFERVQRLAAIFKNNEARYLSPEYHEVEARKEFIDKFWIALDWDVNYEVQTDPYEQEVKVERSTAGRKADYAFCLAPNFHDVRFIVEAKKPSVNVETSDNYFQAIRYGWNNHTDLAVLTDFETLHIIDSRYEPDLETALDRAVAKYHYSDYTKRDKFAEIYWLFSHEAVAAGSLEKRAKELPKPRGKAIQRGLFPGGYQSVDESFLAELDEHRTALARTFKNRNPWLDSETLTELAQRTLDRLVFLRFLEDKGIEGQRLVDRFGEKGPAWGDFVAASRRLDGIYNGIVFRHHDILDASSFHVDDKVFADICESLAHVNSPYDFNAIPIHILGSIYERFLGKVIVATAQRARVEEKPEVRKAGGVYYTPTYIVRYIVENTVGKLIAGKTPEQIATMRFADIACGSGSFLLGVFDLLLDYHGRYYNSNPRKARRGDCVERDGRLYLSLQKKREILLNNIYGVDVDAQAVEVCQFSLYLKLLQEETEASAHQYLLDFAHTERMQRLLPDLGKNIVCGNSLIGSDILEGELFAADEERKLNPMDFEDAFPEVMKRGGFDAIVGNPPYIRVREFRDIHPEQVPYLMSKYACATHVWDIYLLFLERAIQLVREHGKVGFIVPIQTLHQPNCESIRRILLTKTSVDSVADLSRLKVFTGPTVKNTIITCEKGLYEGAKIAIRYPSVPSDLFMEPAWTWPQDSVSDNPGLSMKLSLLSPSRIICKKMEARSWRMSEMYYVTFGLRSCAKGKGQGGKDRLITTKSHSRNAKPYLEGRDINRYEMHPPGRYIQYQSEEMYSPRSPELFEAEKIVSQTMLSRMRLVATYDDQGYYVEQSLLCIIPHGILTPKASVEALPLKFTLGVLNSTLASFYFSNALIDYSLGGGLIHATPGTQGALLLPKPRDNDIRQMVAKVEAMLSAKKQLAQVKTDKDKTYYEKNCAALDRQIDRFVYGLYGLTEEEIAVVEQASAE